MNFNTCQKSLVLLIFIAFIGIRTRKKKKTTTTEAKKKQHFYNSTDFLPINHWLFIRHMHPCWALSDQSTIILNGNKEWERERGETGTCTQTYSYFFYRKIHYKNCLRIFHVWTCNKLNICGWRNYKTETSRGGKIWFVFFCFVLKGSLF